MRRPADGRLGKRDRIDLLKVIVVVPPSVLDPVAVEPSEAPEIFSVIALPAISVPTTVKLVEV